MYFFYAQKLKAPKAKVITTQHIIYALHVPISYQITTTLSTIHHSSWVFTKTISIICNYLSLRVSWSLKDTWRPTDSSKQTTYRSKHQTSINALLLHSTPRDLLFVTKAISALKYETESETETEKLNIHQIYKQPSIIE